MADQHIKNWEKVYELSTTDPVTFGEDGVANIQPKQLEKRTNELKDFVDTHTHTDTYYTKEEFYALLDTYIKSRHNHDSEYALRSYIDRVLRGFHTNMPDHEHSDRYYTKEELLQKIDTLTVSEHHHDDLYMPKSDLDNRLSRAADEDHHHDELYHTVEYIGSQLPLYVDTVHNHDLIYMPKEEFDFSLSSLDMSDHRHPEYCEESNLENELDKHVTSHIAYPNKEWLDSLLSDKADAVHTHSDLITREQAEEVFTTASDAGHLHNDLYEIKEAIDTTIANKSPLDHTHSEIADKGTVDSYIFNLADNTHSHTDDITGTPRVTKCLKLASAGSYEMCNKLGVGLAVTDIILPTPLTPDYTDFSLEDSHPLADLDFEYR